MSEMARHSKVPTHNHNSTGSIVYIPSIKNTHAVTGGQAYKITVNKRNRKIN